MATNILKALNGYDPGRCQVSGLEFLVYITNLQALPPPPSQHVCIFFWLDFALRPLLGVYGRGKKDKPWRRRWASFPFSLIHSLGDET